MSEESEDISESEFDALIYTPDFSPNLEFTESSENDSENGELTQEYERKEIQLFPCLVCGICGEKRTTLKDLRSHLKMEHKDKYKSIKWTCVACGESTTKCNKINLHYRQCSQPDREGKIRRTSTPGTDDEIQLIESDEETTVKRIRIKEQNTKRKDTPRPKAAPLIVINAQSPQCDITLCNSHEDRENVETPQKPMGRTNTITEDVSLANGGTPEESNVETSDTQTRAMKIKRADQELTKIAANLLREFGPKIIQAQDDVEEINEVYDQWIERIQEAKKKIQEIRFGRVTEARYNKQPERWYENMTEKASQASKIQRAFNNNKKVTIEKILNPNRGRCDLPKEAIHNHMKEKLSKNDFEWRGAEDLLPRPKNNPDENVEENMEWKEFMEHKLNACHFDLNNNEVDKTKGWGAHPLLRPISRTEIKRHLGRLKANSAPGPDGITYSNIKKYDPEALILRAFYYCYWKHGKIPPNCKKSKTLLIPKRGGAKDDIDSHRPITMQNTHYKILSGIIGKRLRWWLRSEGCISPEQKGFMSNPGCAEHN